jgi:tRNA-modifying protein YgfZ
VTEPFWCLESRDGVRVAGRDAVSYLQSQLSQDVGQLAVGASNWSLLLQPNGRVDALLRVRRTGDEELLIDVEDGWGEAVLARLQRFRIRVAAELDRIDFSVLAVRGEGVSAPPGAVPAWWGVECGYDEFGPSAAGPPSDAAPGDLVVLETSRVRAGWPAMGREISEQTIPAELGPLLDVAVSFTKGCYPGQELVERMHSRGASAPKLVRRLESAGGPLRAGAPVTVDGREVGTVTSAAGAVALAVVGRAVEPGTEVSVAGTSAIVLPLR